MIHLLYGVDHLGWGFHLVIGLYFDFVFFLFLHTFLLMGE